jgi:predicted 3-demethylubiquinone-9 3-methyltransferase (glyoxalase superfamily)
MQKITPFLWFNDQAEEAMDFYISIFKNSKVISVQRYGQAGPGKPGSVMSCVFELEGQRINALNGGPHFSFTPAISLFIECESQIEVDHYWNKLSEGGDKKAQQCGWLKDKFGLSWQVVPKQLGQMLGDKDAVRSQSVMKAMMQMKKLDISELEKAYEMV